MEYTRLGTSGLRVSRIAPGCMSFGDTSRGFNEWARGDAAAEPFFRQALELGITFWDTANAHGYGTSEEIVGSAIKKYSRREDIVLATRMFFKMRRPGRPGLSRKTFMEQVDASLARLGTDSVDFFQIPRFDPETPIEETMEALHDVVKAGEDQYSLLRREEEREMLPLLADQGVGSIPWSPLAKGRLARPWGEPTARSETDATARRVFPHDDKPIADAVQRIAEARGLPMAQIALAWVLQNPVVAAPIVGATKAHHLLERVGKACGVFRVTIPGCKSSIES